MAHIENISNKCLQPTVKMLRILPSAEGRR